MSIASRIQEMETHIGNAYTSIDNLGIDISNTNKNIYNISPLLDTFYESLPKVSGIGSNLSLSPTMVGKIKLNEIQGDTLQDGTPTPDTPVEIQNVTGLQNIIIQNSLPSGYMQVDYIESTGTQYIELNKKLKKNQKVVGEIEFNTLGNQSLFGNYGDDDYIETFGISNQNKWEYRDAGLSWISSNVVATADTRYNIELYYGATSQYLKINGTDTITSSSTHSDNVSNKNADLFARNNNGTPQSLAKIRLYSWKIYDSDILSLDLVPCFRMSDNVVGLYDLVNNVFYENNGSGVFTYGSVIGNTYEVNLGKNLFDKANITTGKRLYYWQGEVSLIDDANYCVSDYINVNANSTYTINLIMSAYTRMIFFDNNKSPLSVNETNATFTTPNNTAYVRLSVPLNQLDTTQLEKGSQATSHSPYFTPIELNKIGDYQDRIYKDNGKWYLHKETGKVVLNGSESCGVDSSGYVVGFKINDIVKVLNVLTVLDGYSDRYIAGSLTTARNTSNNYGVYDNGTYNLWLNAQNMTINDFKTWLSTHNTEILYPLATPTTIEITNTELINQLESIKSQDGTTNISITSENLPMIINASALKGDVE